jgi:hypothetical protein
MKSSLIPHIRPDGAIPSVPINGQPMTLVETVEHEVGTPGSTHPMDRRDHSRRA